MKKRMALGILANFKDKIIIKVTKATLKPLTTNICLGTGYSLHVFIKQCVTIKFQANF